MRITSLLAIYTLLLSLFPFSLGAQVEDARIMLSKSIVIKPYQDGKVYVEERKVKRGESIWRIYKKNYRLPAGRIPFFMQIFKEMNPDVKDINRVFPNQKITIPFKLAEELSEIPPEEIPVLEPSPPPLTSEEKAKVREKIFTKLKELIVALDKTFVSSGDYRLLPTVNNSPTIDASQSPVIELNGKEKIVMNFDNSLPEDKKGIIASIYSNLIQYEIIDLKGEEKLEDCIDKILRALKFYAVERNPNPLFIFGETEVKIEGDWFVFRDSSLRNIVVINLVEEGKEISPEMQVDVKGYNIKFVNLKR
jgi:hypothetical protein